MKTRTYLLGLSAVLCSGLIVHGEAKVVFDHRSEGTPDFKFKNVPSPSKDDPGTKTLFSIVDGVPDGNVEVERLNDGKLPTGQDEPDLNFFFDVGTEGGRLRADLGSVKSVAQVNSYSWHPGVRGPQVYKLYGSDGTSSNFTSAPKLGTGPENCGWTLIASVDTRPKQGDPGGQYGVSVFDPEGSLGKFRYLLFDMHRTEADDDFGNTFYSEIDIYTGTAADAPKVSPDADAGLAASVTKTFTAGDGKYEITLDATAAPDLMEWADREMRPLVQEWYPKLVDMLPSEGFQPITRFTVQFRKEMPAGIPASAGGGRINLNIAWFRNNNKGEGKGAVVHEMVHIVQRYHRQSGAPEKRVESKWLTEGIPDYIRWFRYEPEAHGADDIWMKRQNFSRVHYDSSYRFSGNFLNWVTEKYSKDLVVRLNAALRDGTYTDDLWKTITGKTAPELGAEWREQLRVKLGIAADEKSPAPAAADKGT